MNLLGLLGLVLIGVNIVFLIYVYLELSAVKKFLDDLFKMKNVIKQMKREREKHKKQKRKRSVVAGTVENWESARAKSAML